MNKKMLAIGISAVLIVSIAVATAVYFQKQGETQVVTYTIIGTLNYAPGHAVFPGISATSIIPSVSPKPSNITFTEPDGANYTVASFVSLSFPRTFNFPPNGYGIDFPVGFSEGDLVRVSGVMSYSTMYDWYVMNVTSITHYSS
jgi:hypothetical protein